MFIAPATSHPAPVTTGCDGTDRIVVTVGTYIAKYRDGDGLICEISTGCRDEDAARSVLGKLERRAELIKSDVLSKSESAMTDHQATPIADHFTGYLNHVRAKGATASHVADLKRKTKRLFAECEFRSLRDIDAEKLEGWLTERQVEEMAARTRNTYLQAVRGFCKWCVETSRLASNPLARMAKADEKSYRRRQRRAMTEAELVKLLKVARLRPLAEYGRETARPDEDDVKASGKSPKRSNWRKAPLAIDTIDAVVERARERLSANPGFIEQLGRARALIYKTLVLTGLRRNELASLSVGQLHLDAPTPYAELDAADEKNRRGATIPLRCDLADDLREWLSDALSPATLKLHADDGKRPLFTVPAGLVRILDRDLRAAGIAKADDRGRTIDVHALRHSFGTLLSKGGVSPRTAQAAMRHSTIDLTMNTYTDPKLLDVHGALNTLPSLDLKSSPGAECQTMRATGTNDREATVSKDNPSTKFAPEFAPNAGKWGQSVSPSVIASENPDARTARTENVKNPRIQAKRPHSQILRTRPFEWRRRGSNP